MTKAAVLSYLAIAFAFAAFVVVLLSPAPRRPAGGAGSTPERLLVVAGREDSAVGEDRREIAKLSERLAVAVEAHEAAGPQDHSEVIRAEVEKELASRWGEFYARVREAREFRRRQQ